MKTGKAEVYHNNSLAGVLEKLGDEEYVFRYDQDYLKSSTMPPISLSFPKREEEYRATTLFPFFFGLLSEGVNKQTQCRLLRIDENDNFTLLLKTATTDTIGSITVKEIL